MKIMTASEFAFFSLDSWLVTLFVDYCIAIAY